MKISVLVPFRHEPGTTRRDNWEWLARRWRALMPHAELVVGTDTGTPFSKTVAVMDAYSRASGDMLVLADADSWVEPGQLLLGCARAAQERKLVVPWCDSYRLTDRDSEAIIAMPPDVANPLTPDMKARAPVMVPGRGEMKGPGPATAAMVVCIRRDSFIQVGGMDSRFRGWGSEDVSFSRACWTLLGENVYLLGQAWALWHDRPRNRAGFRIWSDQDAGFQNKDLVFRYLRAHNHPDLMAELCAEHPVDGRPVIRPGGPVTPAHKVREFAYTVSRDGDRIVL